MVRWFLAGLVTCFWLEDFDGNLSHDIDDLLEWSNLCFSFAVEKFLSVFVCDAEVDCIRRSGGGKLEERVNGKAAVGRTKSSVARTTFSEKRKTFRMKTKQRREI